MGLGQSGISVCDRANSPISRGVGTNAVPHGTVARFGDLTAEPVSRSRGPLMAKVLITLADRRPATPSPYRFLPCALSYGPASSFFKFFYRFAVLPALDFPC